MNKKEIWNIGGAFQSPIYILELNNFLKQMEINNIKLNIFDSHHNLIWNGGNTSVVYPRKKELFVRIVKTYNENGIGFNLVFSNLYVEKKHLSDKRCNYILEQCHREGNGIIVTSHVLAEYIKKNYPKYKLIHSLTHMNTNIDYYLNLKDIYDVFVLPSSLNYEQQKLQVLKDTLGGERIELLVNDSCYKDCPYEKKHYHISSKAAIEQDWDAMEELCDSFCSKHHKPRITEVGLTKELLNIQSRELNNLEVDKLKDQGFYNFKLATRDLSSANFIKEIEYYILEKHKLEKPFSAYKKYLSKNKK